MCCFVKKSTNACSRRGRQRRGQALVEFAVVCLVVYMLLAAVLTFGQMLFGANGSASRRCGRAGDCPHTALGNGQIDGCSL